MALGLFFVLWFTAPSVVRGQSGTLSLGGIAEGARIVLPLSEGSTHLPVSASITGIDGVPAVEFWLEWQGVLLRRLTSAPPHAVTFTNLSPGKYFLGARVGNMDDISADVAFDIVATSLAPANDDWSGAAEIPAVGAVVSASTLHATVEPGERPHAGASGGRSVWWRWRAESDGVITATTLGSDFDTVLATYVGTNVAGLTSVGANDDAGLDGAVFSQVTFTATAGTDYFFAVDGAVGPGGLGAFGHAQLRLLAAAPPTIAGLAGINGLSLLVATDRTPTNITATASIGDPAGIMSVSYWFDGADISRAGELSAPYQLPLTNLVAGDYWLSVMAVSSQGLVTVEQGGLSVIPLNARLWLVDQPAYTPEGFRFALTGLRGADYTVRGSTNLEVWCAVSTLTNFSGAVKMTDTNATRLSPRFYRAETP